MDRSALKTAALLAVIGAVLRCALSQALAAEAEEERWNAYGQATYISQWKDAFPAPYTNLNGTPNSLLPQRERSWSATATAFLGRKLWQGGEIYFVPEMIAQVAFSDLHGIGGAVANGRTLKNRVTPRPFSTSRGSSCGKRGTWAVSRTSSSRPRCNLRSRSTAVALWSPRETSRSSISSTAMPTRATSASSFSR